jgi:DNA helicase-2/ATP-dependent DNA helicase PcrA
MAGPDQLARSLVVGDGGPVPSPWDAAPVERLDEAALGDPAPLADAMRAAARDRRRVVVVCTIDADTLLRAVDHRPPYELGARFAFPLDELHHLVFANSIDARDLASPRWGLLDEAISLGARLDRGGRGDIVTPDGAAVWLDGGPTTFHEPIEGVPVIPAVSVEHGSLAPPLSNTSRAELAPDQLAAVTHGGGAARIIAPAGSGKTRALTERARHLLTNWSLPTAAVSLVAFNKRAQSEMLARTHDLPGLQVRTLNAMALAIVNGTPPFAPQPTTWRTLTEPDVRDVLARLVQFPRKRNADPIAPWIEALGAIRLGLRSPARVETEYDGDVAGLTDVWPRYRAALERERGVDFDDQVFRALEILLTQPDARYTAQRASRLMLVDEFQDLTPAHLLLVRLLSSPAGDVFAVGDDDQTIYGYTGADPTWLIDFAELFPGSGDHPLTVNYRCPAGVVASADRLVRHNRRRVAKVIRAGRDEPADVVVKGGDDPIAATAEVVGRAISSGAAPVDIAVLTRVNSLLAPVQVALGVAGVPVSGGVGTEFASRTAVRAVLTWLRLCVPGRRPFDASDLHEALRRPSRPLHPRIADWVAEQRDLDGLRRLAARVTNERDAQRIDAFADDVDRLQRLAEGGADTEALVGVLVDDIGLAGSVATLDVKRRGTNRPAQGDDLLAVRQLARLHPDAATFERWLVRQLSEPRGDTGVVLATVHRVKGQEWPVVVVHLAGADQFPHRLADDVEEERRLFHVAITRTSREVTVVTGARPSRFVAELSTEPPDDLPIEPTPRRPAERVTRSARSDDPLLDRDAVVVGAGLVIVDGGRSWVVESIDAEGAVARQGSATRRFVSGAKVTTFGRQRGAVRIVGDSVGEHTPAVYDGLRAARERLRDGKPAYVVFDDKTLAAISRALPDTLEQLAAVRGVGPAKLEQYGDEVLAVIATVRADR